MNKKIAVLGLFLVLAIGLVSANELTTDINQPLFIKMVCAGTNPSADIQIYSGTAMIPDNLVVSRTLMSQLSDQDFEYMATFSIKGTYTAFEECSYDGGFISTQTTTIIVTDPTNLLEESTLAGYDYQANLFYDVFFKVNPLLEDAINFQVEPDTITFQPKELSLIAVIRDGKVTKKSVNIQPSEVIGYVSGNTFIYPALYGEGLDLQYLINKNYVKEELVINDMSNLPVSTNELEKKVLKKDATIYVELKSIMTTTTKHIIVDGTEWDMKKPISTSNLILIKNDAGETIYQLQIPVAFDSDGSKVIGTYTLNKIKKSKGHEISVSVRMPYSWFVDTKRVYPVYIDPTIDTPDGTGVFDNSAPEIILENLTIPAGIPYTIIEQIVKGNTTIMDAECELDIIDDTTQTKVIDFRSFYNDGFGNMLFTWAEPYVGTFTASQYCWRGDTLVLNKIYKVSSILVTE